MRIIPVLIATFFLCGSKTFSQETIPVYANTIPNSIVVENQETITARKSGGEWVAKVSVPTLTYYPALTSNQVSPAILVCPGGGYAGLAIEKEGHLIAKEFQKNGIAAFVLKYRMPSDETMKDKSTGPLQDAQTALVTIRKNAAKWNINPDQVGVIGFSAGGHLASTVSTHFQRPVVDTQGISVRPDFMILMYPVISMKDSLTHRGSRNNLIGNSPSEKKVYAYSNEEQVTPDVPPTFIVHAGDDKVVKVENALRFYEALQQNNVKAQMILYPAGGHGFGLNNRTTSDKWMHHCMAWLEDYVFIKKSE